MDLQAWIAARTTRRRVEMVVFDCDGVLIDSEPLCNRVVAEETSALGYPMTPHEAETRFIGLSFHDTRLELERLLGRAVSPAWVERVTERVTQLMLTEAEPIPGALAAVDGVTALGLPWRVASNAAHRELSAKFTRLGMTDRVAGRVHSAEDMRRLGRPGKPAPDIYLAAAAADGVDPAACLVVEDSATGVRAARAAGMQCLGYAPGSDGGHLVAHGAVPIRSMHAVPEVLRALLEPFG